jgi:hypothetical protein
MTQQAFQCSICAASLAKGEVQFVDDYTFPLLSALPAGLVAGSYCVYCFEVHVGPELERYKSQIERAKNVNVFYVSQSKESRFVRRVEKPVRVENCQDPEDVVLRLAFLAVQAGKNALVDVDLKSIKVRNGGWQSSLWSGRAVPANIEQRSLDRRFRGTPN